MLEVQFVLCLITYIADFENVTSWLTAYVTFGPGLMLIWPLMVSMTSEELPSVSLIITWMPEEF